MKRYSVFLVEDDDAMRAWLGQAIRSHPDLVLAGEASSLGAARAALAGASPDVLLTDLGLPDGSGIELIREVKRRGAASEAMVVTVFGDEQHVVAAVEAGATGYILKDGSSESVTESIVELVRGGSPISPAIARHLLRRFRQPAPPAPDIEAPGLTDREREVLGLLVKGFTFPEIGGLLDISAHTVKSHVKHIYEKLEVRSRAEAVYEAMQLGLVEEKG